MEKKDIKIKVRESLLNTLKETEPKAAPDNGKDKNYAKNYQEIQRKLDGTMLKASQVMAAANLGDPDDATARSLFSKKLRRDTNEEGGVYQFDEKELAAIIKIINNPGSYLNVKKN